MHSISSKYDSLRLFVKGKVYFIIVMKNKLEQTFPSSPSLWWMVIVKHNALTETEAGYIFEKTLNRPLLDHTAWQ